MKLPFFNRQRYVVLRAYTPVEYVATHTPIALAKQFAPSFESIGKRDAGFKTCYGHIASLKRSASVLSPCDIEVTATKEQWTCNWPGQQYFTVSGHDQDPQYRSKDMFITKLQLPWAITTNKPDIAFVMCSHILNDTEMRIPSGIVSYRRMRDCNIFNYVTKKDHVYTIPFKKPLASIYPLTDLPFYVESEFNHTRHKELMCSSMNKPTFKNSEIYLSR